MVEKGYGIMPNKILFAVNLTDKQKLLYVLISSLCAEKGFCRASNKYLSDKLGFKESRASKQITDMNKKSYIGVYIDKAGGNRRKISLSVETYGTVVPDPMVLQYQTYGTGVLHNSISNKDKIIRYIEDDEMNELFKNFLSMRKKIKKPATDRAIKILLKELDKLSGGDSSKKKQMLENSIVNNRQGFYELKQETKKTKYRELYP